MESLNVGRVIPRLLSLLQDQTQPGIFFREKEEAGNKVWSPSASGQRPHASPLSCMTRPNQGFSLERKKKQEQSLEYLGVWTTSPRLPFLLYDRTQPGIFSREKEEAKKLVWSPLASGQLSHPPSLLHDQTQPGLFSREMEETGNKVWSHWTSGQLPHASPFCRVTRLNQGSFLVRTKKQGTKFGVSGRLDNFPTPPLPAA